MPLLTRFTMLLLLFSLRDGQCGRRPGRGCDFASHTVRLFAALSKRLGLSWAALFADVAAACHIMTIRQFCIGHLHADESVAALLRRFRLDAADFSQFVC